MDGMKRDSEFTHFIAIDFGTYGCGMAVSTNVDPDSSHVYANWVQSKIGQTVKCPTALLLNDEGEFEAFGDEALYTYQAKNRVRRPHMVDQYYFFYRFKMCLYNKVRTSGNIASYTECLHAWQGRRKQFHIGQGKYKQHVREVL